MLTSRHHFWPPALVLAGCLVVAASGVEADSVSVEVDVNGTVELILPGTVDDEDFRDPRGCNQPGSFTRRFQQKVVVENIGDTPLAAVDLIVNGQDWSQLDLPEEPGALARHFFDFWINAQFHASSGHKAQEDAWSALGFWGYSLCGENVQALARFMSEKGIAARQVPVNGHVVAEYFFDGKWNVLDGDQHTFFPMLDNRTLASAEDLRQDPFLAQRVKPFGKYAAFKRSTAQYNSALFERIAPEANRDQMEFKEEVKPALRQDLLRPGENLTFLRELEVEPLGVTELEAWPGAKLYGLGTMLYSLQAAGRVAKENLAEIESAFPIRQVKNDTTGETVGMRNKQAVFAHKIRTSGPKDRISVWCQRSQVSLPTFRSGKNKVALRSKGGKRARVTVEYQSAAVVQPVAGVEPGPGIFTEPPIFNLRLPEGTDMIWWQLTTGKDYEFLIPNFEQVRKAIRRVEIDPLSATFFNPGDQGRFRFKVRRDGVWSEWSDETKFELRLPTAPQQAKVTALAENRVRVEWSGAAEEFIVFGSNRLDFLPEVFAEEEILAMNHVVVEKSQPNKNLLIKTTSTLVELPVSCRFLRVVARNGKAYSAPSALLRVPDSLAKSLPAARVLQCRATRHEDATELTGYDDVYRSTEMEIR